MSYKPNGRSIGTAEGAFFETFFTSADSRDFRKGSLIDNRARRLFDMTAAACEAGVYPYQLALSGRSGPWVQAEGREMLMLSSYDYLGLIGDPRIDEAAMEAVRIYGTGTGGVRLLTGTLELHRQMEKDLAAFKGTEAAITFSSGYSANLAVVAALLTSQDRVILDALAHRSLVDACRLAGAPMQRFRHNDPDSLRHELKNGPPANRTLIVADGVFSMDGDICRLPELIELKKEFKCYLMIDESHATGVLGAHGRGTDEHFGIPAGDVDIWTGSLGKAIPASGGFVAGSQELAIYLQHAAAPFIFSAAVCPMAVAAARAAIQIIETEPERVARLKCNSDFLRGGLRDLGYDVGLSETAVVPVLLGDEQTAGGVAAHLREMGILVSPIMFPAVPLGTARLRLCATAAHTFETLGIALDAFRQLRP
jgi:8-amino-7-oxononanoate synthase